MTEMRLPSRYPVLLFTVSRTFVLFFAVIGFLVIRPDRAANTGHDPSIHDFGWPVDIWANWDGTWYAEIAAHGYARASSTAFFPLYPLLARAVSWVLGGHVVIAAVLVSLAACLGSFVLLYRLTALLAGPEVAGRAVLYLALFPTALFLQAAYSESLMLLLALATFLLAERGRFGWAGVTCGLALLTRPAGIALVIALAAFRPPGQNRRGIAGAAALAAAFFCLYPLGLGLSHHGALSFLSAQHHWGRSFSPFGPVIAVVESLIITLLYVGTLVSPPAAGPELHAFQHAAFNNVVSLAALVVFLVLLDMLRRRYGVRSPYFVYAAVSLALPLFSPIDGNPLLSVPRFGLVIFPFFIVLAETFRNRPRLHLAYVAACTPLLALASAAFAVEAWVG